MRSNSLTVFRNLLRLVTLPFVAFILPGLFGLAPANAAEAHIPTDAEAMGILQAVCPGQIRKEASKGGPDYGCGGCPSFTGFAGQDPSPGNAPDFDLRQVLEGSFTRPGATEMLAEFFGCEPHVSNFGGTVLFEVTGQKWRRVRYAAGVIGLMRTYARLDGRDLVLVQAGYTGQGQATNWIAAYDFSLKPDPGEHTLLTLEDNSGNACEAERVAIGYFDKIEYPDLNGDGKPDLRVALHWGHASVPAKFRGHCDRAFKPPPAPVYTIDFLFDGKSFRVAPGSAALLRKVSAKN